MKKEFDKRFGIIEYNSTYYKSCAIFKKDEFYSDAEKEVLVKNVKNKEGKIKKFYVPCVNADFNTDIITEYKKCEKEIKNEKNQNVNDLKIHKNRYYLKVVKQNSELENNDKILTFILFNSSFANHFKIDPTIQNCAYLTFIRYKKENYDGFEILNLFSIRNSENILKDTNVKDDNIDFIEKHLLKKSGSKIVLAWGYSNQQKCPKRIKLLLSKIDNKNLKQISNKNNEDKIMHPDNRAWIRNPFKDYAIITDYIKNQL